MEEPLDEAELPEEDVDEDLVGEVATPPAGNQGAMEMAPPGSKSFTLQNGKDAQELK